MIRTFSFALLTCLFIETANGVEPNLKENQARIAAAIEKIPSTKIKLTLYSLDPHDARRFSNDLPENSEMVFRGFPILGKAEIVPEQEKASLLGSLAKGIRESSGFGAWCFDPRHGLRVVSDSTTNDFVICFECAHVQTYGFSASSYFSTTASPEPAFDKLLKKYSLKKAQ